MLRKPVFGAMLALFATLAVPSSASFAESGGYAPSWQKDGEADGDGPRSITPRSKNGGDGSRSDERYSDRYSGRNAGNGPPPPYRGAKGPYDSPRDEHDSFSSDEIVDAGHSFFGSVTKGLADVVEYAFARHGRPNGYILGEEGGGAYFAGLRYGEGRLYTKHMGVHKVFWQGPSLGIDVGGDGSKTMVLVYNLHYPEEMFERFGGVDGSAYVVGGVGITFLTRGKMVLAPIRSGLGLRLGANIGYLKYTPYPTWNPF
jgi:hypothetical protein